MNSNNIHVAIKLRPVTCKEKSENLPIQWRVEGNNLKSVNSSDTYTFDHIFDSDSNNIVVYETVVKPLVEASSKGFNATVFAYGQTSSGKTYTMMGNHSEPGVVSLAVQQLFSIVENSHNTDYLLRVSYLEIYNEKIIDLLEPNRQIHIHEDITGNVFTTVKEEIVKSTQELFKIKKKGDKYRRVGETNMNERSSRSHAIFKIIIESSQDSRNIVQVSHLNLVDLAGSERASQTGATGARLKEGQHINKSLSTLSFVIRQLSESQDQNRYVNFRDSKLTRILQSSLGGNAKTVIICTVTPVSFEETQSTLAFASQAKYVKNKPKVNGVVTDEALLKRYAIQVQKLKLELSKTQQDNKNLQENHLQIAMHNKMLKKRIALLEKPVLRGSRNQQNRRITWCGNINKNILTSNILLEKDDFDMWDHVPLEEFERELIDAERSKLCIDVEDEDTSSVSSEATDIFSKETELASKLQILEQEYESLKMFQKEEYLLIKEENNKLAELNTKLQFELKQIVNLLYAVMQQSHSPNASAHDVTLSNSFGEDLCFDINKYLQTYIPEYEEIRRRLIYLNTLTDKYKLIKKQYNVLQNYILQLQNKNVDESDTSLNLSDNGFHINQISTMNDISTLLSEITNDMTMLHSYFQQENNNAFKNDSSFYAPNTEMTKLNNSNENVHRSCFKSEEKLRDHVKKRRKSQRDSLLESLRGVSSIFVQEQDSFNNVNISTDIILHKDKCTQTKLVKLNHKGTLVTSDLVISKENYTQTKIIKFDQKDTSTSDLDNEPQTEKNADKRNVLFNAVQINLEQNEINEVLNISRRNCNKENVSIIKQQNKLEIKQKQCQLKRQYVLDAKRGLSSAVQLTDVAVNTDSDSFYKQLCLCNAKIVELRQELKIKTDQITRLTNLNNTLHLEHSDYLKKIEKLKLQLLQKEVIKKNVASNTDEMVKEKYDVSNSYLANVASGIVGFQDLENYCSKLEKKLVTYKSLCKIREAEKRELEKKLSIMKK